MMMPMAMSIDKKLSDDECLLTLNNQKEEISVSCAVVEEEEREEEDEEERVRCVRSLVLDDQSLSLSVPVRKNIAMSRRRVREALRGNGRLVAVVALPYTCQHAVLRAAQKVQSYCQSHHLTRNIEVVIRVDFSPSSRQVIPGWKGLMADPHKNGTYDVLHGTNLTRSLLTNLINLGMAVGTESVDIISPQMMCDLISWSSIRSCSTESQIHRELASGMPCPVGFSTSASNLQIAMDPSKPPLILTLTWVLIQMVMPRSFLHREINTVTCFCKGTKKICQVVIWKKYLLL